MLFMMNDEFLAHEYLVDFIPTSAYDYEGFVG